MDHNPAIWVYAERVSRTFCTTCFALGLPVPLVSTINPDSTPHDGMFAGPDAAVSTVSPDSTAGGRETTRMDATAGRHTVATMSGAGDKGPELLPVFVHSAMGGMCNICGT